MIENGINLDRFNPVSQFKDLRREFGFSDSDFVIGFVARCTLQKNPVDFLKAIKIAHERNNRIKGLFVGEGDMDAEVDSFIENNQMHSYVFRSAFRTDVPDLLHCMDVYCLPSLWEGLYIALLEAMAMGKAIIATPTDGTKELIVDGVDAISGFCKDRDLLSYCSKEARKVVEKRFNAQRVAESVSEIYLKYLDS